MRGTVQLRNIKIKLHGKFIGKMWRKYWRGMSGVKSGGDSHPALGPRFVAMATNNLLTRAASTAQRKNAAARSNRQRASTRKNSSSKAIVTIATNKIFVVKTTKRK